MVKLLMPAEKWQFVPVGISKGNAQRNKPSVSRQAQVGIALDNHSAGPMVASGSDRAPFSNNLVTLPGGTAGLEIFLHFLI